MSSDLKVTNIKHSSSGSNNLVLASDGNVSITNTLSAGTIGDAIATTSDTRRLVRVSRSTNTSSASSNTGGSYVELFSADFTATSGRTIVIIVNSQISVRANNHIWAKIQTGSTVLGLNHYFDNAVNGHIGGSADFLISGSDVGTGSNKTYTISMASDSNPSVTVGGNNSIVFMEFI